MVNQSTAIWNQKTYNNVNNITLSSSPDSTCSRETRASFDSAISLSSGSSGDQSYYVMSPPSQPQQWGIYPSIPPCPPPQVQFPQPAPQPPQPPMQMPTPLYVTFSDGTTLVVPAAHRLPDAPLQQPPPTQSNISLCRTYLTLHNNDSYFK